MVNNAIHSWHPSDEFVGAELGDKRRGGRLLKIVDSLERDPAKSFPRSMGSDDALEGFYRFINNDGFAAEDIVAPHFAATLKRAKAARDVIAIHDTTFVEYAASREDLGPTTGKNRFGFGLHAVLLVEHESGVPLGCARTETLKRSGRKRRNQERRTQKAASDPTCESQRWIRGVEAVENERNDQFEVIHVTDAEGDFYDFLASFAERKARFVIRAGNLARIVLNAGDRTSLRDIADGIAPKTWRTVDLNERRHRPRSINPARLRRHPERDARSAELAVGAT